MHKKKFQNVAYKKNKILTLFKINKSIYKH